MILKNLDVINFFQNCEMLKVSKERKRAIAKQKKYAKRK